MVLEDRKSRAAVQEIITAPWRVVVEAVHAFEDAPAVILSSGAGRRLEVDLFPGVLSDIGNKKVPGSSIERAAPWVAQTVGPDFIQPGTADKRIVGRHRVVAVRIAREIIAVDVHAQDFAQPGFEILSGLERISATTTVAYGNIEVAIRTESELTAVMIAAGLILRQDNLRRVGIGHVRVAGGNLVAGNDCGPVVDSGVIDVEESV